MFGAVKARLVTLIGVALVGAVLALPLPTAHAVPLPASAASVQEKSQRYFSARESYISALDVYLSHGRSSTREYAVAIKAYSTAQAALQAAKREVAKTFSDAVQLAKAQQRAALKAAKTVEQRAAAAAAFAAAVNNAAAARDDATAALLPMPAAPPKVIKPRP